MSGIAGILHLDGAPIEPARIQRMNDALAGRGPDAQGQWTGKSIGLGHRAFWTTPEATNEIQPHQDAAAALAITFDGRIDNRAELARQLQKAGCPPQNDTNVEIVLRAYQAWGESCAARLLGDFAFAIWDDPRSTLFCARDLFGARPLCYHFRPGKVFAFASTPGALFAGSVLPRQLNEARIADYLVSELEGIDKTSTYYADVFRLPPAHAATIGPTGLSLKRYWKPQPGAELRLATDKDYEDAFLEAFGKAVECRLGAGDTVASMLSGGMDSSSIVGIARKLRVDAGGPPLRTFSVTRREPAGCPETQAMLEMLKLDNLNPVTLNDDQLTDLQPKLSQQTWRLEEPYDYHMIVPRSLYILARRQGVRVMLDGIDGDSILSAGSHLVRLLRHGHAVTAWRDALGQHRVHDGEPSVATALIHAARSAVAPDWVRRGLRPWRNRQRWQSVLADSLIHPRFAAQTGLRERLETLNQNSRTRHPLDRESEIAGIIDHPYIVCGVERYERVAAASGVETRHPFLDRRVVEFCMRLPDSQKFRDGWPKSILRRAMTGYLPETVNWRYGKQHLGEYLTLAYAKRIYPEIKQKLLRGRDTLAPYIRLDEVEKSLDTYELRGEPEVFWRLYETAHLANWLEQQRGE